VLAEGAWIWSSRSQTGCWPLILLISVIPEGMHYNYPNFYRMNVWIGSKLTLCSILISDQKSTAEISPCASTGRVNSPSYTSGVSSSPITVHSISYYSYIYRTRNGTTYVWSTSDLPKFCGGLQQGGKGTCCYCDTTWDCNWYGVESGYGHTPSTTTLNAWFCQAFPSLGGAGFYFGFTPYLLSVSACFCKCISSF